MSSWIAPMPFAPLYSLLETSPALAAALAIVLVLAFQINLQYKLLGGSFIEGLLASPLARLGNGWWCKSTRKKMDAAGILRPHRTMEYAPGLLLDVYDLRSPDKTADVARCGAVAAPAVLYFHAGAFLVGGREMGAGTLSWLAEQGLVGISVGYRLTSDAQGRGIAGCIASAWAALRFVRAHADELGIDPSRIVAMGDSAGGLLALALATGLCGGGDGGGGGDGDGDGDGDAPLVERPLAAVAGWGCCTIESRSFAPVRAADGGGGWEDTPAAAAFATPCVFVPEGTGATAAAAQRQLQVVLSGSFLAFGRRVRGWLPASSRRYWPADDGASISPLSRASAPGMAPTLLLVGGSDEVVPAGQQLLFAERARAAGNRAGALVFDRANPNPNPNPNPDLTLTLTLTPTLTLTLTLTLTRCARLRRGGARRGRRQQRRRARRRGRVGT